MTPAFRSFVIATLLAALATGGCFSDPRADRVSREDQRILRVLVGIECKLEAETLVVSNRPAVPRQESSSHAGSPNVQFGIDVSQRVAREARWPTRDLCPYVHVVADPEIDAVLAHDSRSWDNFTAAFHSRSLMRISLPVYSADGKRAVVYTEGHCPYQCGAGFYHELVKTPSGWRVVNSVNAWRI